MILNILYFSKKNYIVFFLLFFFIFIGRVQSQDSDEIHALKIESKTVLCSADFYIKKEKGEDVDENSDKERKKIGMGEEVILTLTGKPKGNISKLEWKITEGDNLCELVDKTKGTDEVKLVAKKNIKNGGNAEITVTTGEGIVKFIKFEILIPNRLSGEHLNGGTSSGIKDGDIDIVGASAQIKVTVEPTEVSFKNIKLIERDKGSKPLGFSLDKGHKDHGCDARWDIDEKNQFVDHIIGGEFFNQMDNHDLPQEWVWVCEWNVHVGPGGKDTEDKDIFTVQTVDQNFSFKKINDWNYIVKIIKFNCAVERDTRDYKNKFN